MYQALVYSDSQILSNVGTKTLNMLLNSQRQKRYNTGNHSTTLIADLNKCTDMIDVVLSPGDIIIIILWPHNKLHVIAELAGNAEDVDRGTITTSVGNVFPTILIMVRVLPKCQRLRLSELCSEIE